MNQFLPTTRYKWAEQLKCCAQCECVTSEQVLQPGKEKTRSLPSTTQRDLQMQHIHIHPQVRSLTLTAFSLYKLKDWFAFILPFKSHHSNRKAIVAITNTHTHARAHKHRAQGGFPLCIKSYESQETRWPENALRKRGCSHKSVYWAVLETCRQTLGSPYQISNLISQMPSLLRHHMRLPDSLNRHRLAAVGLFTHRCF